MGIIRKDANLYDRKGKSVRKAFTYPKEDAPVRGLNVMFIGLSKHMHNIKKGIKR